MATVQTGDIETFYEQEGSGPPVVFIHGALADHTAAAAQLEAFSHGYTAIAYDLRGHGRTANPGHAPYTMETLAEDLHAFVTELGLDQPIICGVSMGGMVAQVYASRYPEELGGLVLADTFSPTFLSRRDRIERSSVVRAIGALIRVVGYNRAKGLIMWLGRKLGRDQAFRTEAFPDMATAVAVNAFRAVATFHTVAVDLGAIAVPTLVLYGEHESAIMSRHVPELTGEIPDSTATEVPEAGHASPWDNPEFFNTEIREFIATRATVEAAV